MKFKENSCQLREFVTQLCLLFTVCPAGWKPGEKTVKSFITPTSCIYTCYTLFVCVMPCNMFSHGASLSVLLTQIKPDPVGKKEYFKAAFCEDNEAKP